MFLGLPDPHPDPLVRGADPKIRIRDILVLLESSVLLFRDETAGNGSHGCQIYNPALMECHVKWEPSYFQFWEKYILQVTKRKDLK